MSWQKLSEKARQTYFESFHRTLELFPFDTDAELDALKSLPTAIGASVTDFGAPALFPIDELHQKLPRGDLLVTLTDPVELSSRIRAGELTCVDVLRSFFHAALYASILTNCVVEFLPDRALERARYLDEHAAEAAALPMFGIPLSLKEMIPLKGRSVTHGSLCFLDRVAAADADIVQILEAAGAVPFVRTTNPQSLMMLECESYTHGRTVNPFNSTLTSGGSSGGEGALNGMHASGVGLGSDIGGSIRCPAAFNGIYGMRTTVGRLPTSDYLSCQMGSESILSVTGPLSSSLATLERTMKTVVDSQPWLRDPTLVPLAWTPSPKRKFRVGVLFDDGVVKPQYPIERVLHETFAKLDAHPDFEVVRFEPHDHAKAMEIISALYFEDGGADTRSTLDKTGEPMCEQTSWVLADKQPLEVSEIWSWNLQKQQYRKEYLQHWLSYSKDSEPLDAVIAPVFPGPAAKHRTAKYWGYTAQWNLLDYPVLVYPVSEVSLIDDVPPETDYTPRNEMDQFVQEQYQSPDDFENAPLSLGIVGLRYSEELLIEIAKSMQV